MAALTALAIGGALAGGLFAGKKLAKKPAAPAPTAPDATAATQQAAAQADVAATAPPSTPKAESDSFKAAREASAKIRKRIPGGGFAGGSRVSAAQRGVTAGYAPRTLIGG